MKGSTAKRGLRASLAHANDQLLSRHGDLRRAVVLAILLTTPSLETAITADDRLAACLLCPTHLEDSHHQLPDFSAR